MGISQTYDPRYREVLARLDRIATVSRGHRAGLHLDDARLLEQYVRVLAAWEQHLLQPESDAPAAKRAPVRQASAIE